MWALKACDPEVTELERIGEERDSAHQMVRRLQHQVNLAAGDKETEAAADTARAPAAPATARKEATAAAAAAKKKRKNGES